MILDYTDIDEFLKPLSPATYHPDVFTEEDLDEYTTFMFRSTTRWRTSETGNLFFSGNLDEIYRMIKPKVSKYLDLRGVSKVIGNFYHTPHQYGFHTDMPEKEHGGFRDGDVPYKSLLIPLYRNPSTSNCHIFFFKERLISPGTTFDKGSSKSTTHYNSCTDYNQLKSLYSATGTPIEYKETQFPKKIFEQYEMGKTSPIERFDGFHLEAAFSWDPTSLIVFDTSQLHCSNLGVKKALFKTKAGLRLSLWKNTKGKRNEII